jgi:cytochrome P450
VTETRFDPRIEGLVASLPDDPDPQLVYRQKAGDVRFERMAGAVHLYRMRDILAVNRDPTVLGTGGRGGAFATDMPLIPLEVDGPEHATWRRLLDPMFSPKRTRALERSVRDRAAGLIDGCLAELADGGRVEFYSRFCMPLPCLTFLRLVGAPEADLGFFLEFKEGVVHPAGDTVEEMNANMAAAGMKLYQYFTEFIAERRTAPPTDDVLGELLTAQVAGRPVTDLELLNIMFLLMFAGLDTVSASLSCLVGWFARHPAERDRVVADEGLLPGAIEELMRYESPVPSGTRYATVELDLGDGLVIAPGEAIHTLWAAANVDPTAFDDPLRPALDRPRHTHIAFASGTHRCLGSHLARMELRVALEELHRRIPRYRIAPGEELRFSNISVRSAQYLPIALD